MRSLVVTWSDGMGHSLVQMHMQAGLNLTSHGSTKTVDNNNKRLAVTRSVWIVSQQMEGLKNTSEKIKKLNHPVMNTGEVKNHCNQVQEPIRQKYSILNYRKLLNVLGNNIKLNSIINFRRNQFYNNTHFIFSGKSMFDH